MMREADQAHTFGIITVWCPMLRVYRTDRRLPTHTSSLWTGPDSIACHAHMYVNEDRMLVKIQSISTMMTSYASLDGAL